MQKTFARRERLKLQTILGEEIFCFLARLGAGVWHRANCCDNWMWDELYLRMYFSSFIFFQAHSGITKHY